MPKPVIVGAALLVGGLTAAACGSAVSHSATPAASAASPPGSVQVKNVTGVGPVLTDPTGRTLYLLSTDHQAMATCLASPVCANAWPPLELPSGASSAVAGRGVQSSLLSTIPAPGGHLQVTYNRWPLYTFVGDSGPGQDKGQDLHAFGGVWSAVTGAGAAATVVAAPAPSSSGSSGGYSGGY
ncbi:MAG: COG4315 family predicted lipoprotein [Acidimicrobiales bacterium]